jgi:hypothetical protein
MERFLIDYTGPSAKKRKTAEERLKQQRDFFFKSGPGGFSGGPMDNKPDWSLCPVGGKV